MSILYLIVFRKLQKYRIMLLNLTQNYRYFYKFLLLWHLQNSKLIFINAQLNLNILMIFFIFFILFIIFLKKRYLNFIEFILLPEFGLTLVTKHHVRIYRTLSFFLYFQRFRRKSFNILKIKLCNFIREKRPINSACVEQISYHFRNFRFWSSSFQI